MTEWYDMTISIENMKKNGVTEDMVRSQLNASTLKWAYGKEQGDSGYSHLQVKCQTREKPDSMMQRWSRLAHVSQSHTRNFDYVMKDGEYVCSWKESLNRYASFETALEWQKHAKASLLFQTEREILCVVDVRGGSGKSWLSRHLESTGEAKVIPKMERAEDMISAAMVNPSSAYVFDIPRSGNKNDEKLWIAIEQIKNGHLYDWRYQYRELWIEPPKILVFSNYRPETDRLSEDRWTWMDVTKEPRYGSAAPTCAGAGGSFDATL